MMFLSGRSYLADVNYTLRDTGKKCPWSPLAKEPGRAAWQHDTGVQNLAEVNLTLLDVLLRSVVTQRKRLSQAVMMFSLGKRKSSPCLNFPRQLSSVS